MIEGRGVVYAYKGRKVLHDLDFTIARGSVTALVGPNGAGKTTLINCLVGLVEPLSGVITMDGMDMLRHPMALRRRIGYMTDSFGLYKEMTVRQALTYLAIGHCMARSEIPARVEAVADRLGIAAYLDSKADDMSRGYRQRTGVAMALVHAPDILILDEPASGLDPESRGDFSEFVRGLCGEGLTIIISSHILTELEGYSTDMMVMQGGHIRAHMNFAAYRMRAIRSLHVELTRPDERALALIRGTQGISNANYAASKMYIHAAYEGSDDSLAALLKTLVAADVPVSMFFSPQRSMNEVYKTIIAGQEEV